MAKDQYTLQIQADITDIKSKLNNLEQSVNQTTTKGESAFSKMGAGVVVFNQALELGRKALQQIEKVYGATVEKAIDQEEIFRELQTAVELTGKSWGEAKGELDGLFASLQATTKYGDTESAATLKTLIQLTGSYDKGTEALSNVLDLTATGLFDASAAAKYYALALEGDVSMLGRYIPQLKATNNEIVKNGTAAEKTEEFLRIFNEKFKGTAQKNLQSSAAQLKQLKNYLGDLGEAIGDKALPAVNKITGAMTRFVASLVQTDLDRTIARFRQLGIESKTIMELQKIQLERNVIKLNSELDKQGPKYKTIEDALSKAEIINNRILEIEKEKAGKQAEIENITNEIIRLNGKDKTILEITARAMSAQYESQIEQTEEQKKINGLVFQRKGLQLDQKEIHKKELSDLGDEAAVLEKTIGLMAEKGRTTEEVKLIEVEIKNLKSEQTVVEEKAKVDQKQKLTILTKEQEQQLAILKIKADISAEDEKQYLTYLNSLLPVLDDQSITYWEIYAAIQKINQENEKRLPKEDELTDKMKAQLAVARNMSGFFGDMVYDAENLGDALVDAAKRFSAQIAQDIFYYMLWTYITGGQGTITGLSPISMLFGQSKGMKGFAGGVDSFGGGIAKVHKDELVTNLPKGTSVFDKNETADILGGSPALEKKLDIVNANLTDLINTVKDYAVSVKINDRDIFESNQRELDKRNRVRL